MGVVMQHYALVGQDIENITKELENLPFAQQFKSRSEIDIEELNENLENKVMILDDGMSSHYCFICIPLVISEDSRNGEAFFDEFSEISFEEIEYAKEKLLASPLSPLLDPQKIKLYVGTHWT